MDASRFFVVSALILLSACSEWPPFSSDAGKVFSENRESFDRLAEKMRETDYWRVSLSINGSVEVTPTLDGPEPSFIIDDDPEWGELLGITRMRMVLQSDDGWVWANPGFLWAWRDNQFGSSGYTNAPILGSELLPCKPEFKKLECGRCAVPLEDDWYIHYEWQPEYFSEDDWQLLVDDEVSWDEYSGPFNDALDQCLIDGYTEIGYDANKLFEFDDGRELE